MFGLGKICQFSAPPSKLANEGVSAFLCYFTNGPNLFHPVRMHSGGQTIKHRTSHGAPLILNNFGGQVWNLQQGQFFSASGDCFRTNVGTKLQTLVLSNILNVPTLLPNSLPISLFRGQHKVLFDREQVLITQFGVDVWLLLCIKIICVCFNNFALQLHNF